MIVYNAFIFIFIWISIWILFAVSTFRYHWHLWGITGSTVSSRSHFACRHIRLSTCCNLFTSTTCAALSLCLRATDFQALSPHQLSPLRLAPCPSCLPFCCLSILSAHKLPVNPFLWGTHELSVSAALSVCEWISLTVCVCVCTRTYI